MNQDPVQPDETDSLSSNETQPVSDTFPEAVKTVQETVSINESPPSYQPSFATEKPSIPEIQNPSESANLNPSTTIEAPVQNASVPLTSTEELPPSDIPHPASQYQTAGYPAGGVKVKKSPVKTILYLLIFLIVIIFLLGSVFSYLLAYDKVKLSKYPELQTKVAGFVISLPFMPKTPKYLLARTLYAHSKVSKHKFDISTAIESAGFESVFGPSRFDFETVGSIDYSDEKNVRFMLDANLTKEFSLKLSKSDKVLYFKIDKLPSFLLAYLGLTEEKVSPLLEKWVAYDTTPLETEAGKALEDKEIESVSEGLIEKMNDTVLDENLFKKINISEVSEDGEKVYKMTLNFDKELIDYLDKNVFRKDEIGTFEVNGVEAVPLSDMVKSLNWEMSIGKKDYLTRKISVSSEFEFDKGVNTGSLTGNANLLADNSKANFALVLKFSDFGSDFAVETPSVFYTYEEYASMVAELVSEIYSGLQTDPFSNASDKQRRTDLRSLQFNLEYYKNICKSYPEKLDYLYARDLEVCDSQEIILEAIPKDPNGSDYYYTVDEDGFYHLCANLEEGVESVEKVCPDEGFNYHITNAK